MPIILTSTGIQYGTGGPIQTKNTALIPISTVSGINPAVSTYEWTGIPSDAKRVRLIFHSASISATGPNTGYLYAYGGGGGLIASATGAYLYGGSNNRFNSSDLLYYSTYHNIGNNGMTLDIHRISAGSTSYYMYHTAYGGRYGITAGRFSCTGTLNKLSWVAGSTITQLTAALYYEKA